MSSDNSTGLVASGDQAIFLAELKRASEDYRRKGEGMIESAKTTPATGQALIHAATAAMAEAGCALVSAADAIAAALLAAGDDPAAVDMVRIEEAAEQFEHYELARARVKYLLGMPAVSRLLN